jgi:hypothetical protein
MCGGFGSGIFTTSEVTSSPCPNTSNTFLHEFDRDRFLRILAKYSATEPFKVQFKYFIASGEVSHDLREPKLRKLPFCGRQGSKAKASI